ncbi:MAG TPA: hypothetical protein VHO06_24245 [Polyangia bacterium]|nr:hypothetical protein [Polyangia bacterium]
MNEVFRAAADLQAFCDTQGWRQALIGGLAVLRWGEPRETVDVDLTLLTGFRDEDRLIRLLLERYRPRIPNAAAFAIGNRVLLVENAAGVGLDIALAGMRTCSAEDLIVLKTFAARPRDWIDVEGIIVRQTGHLDWSYVREQLLPLLELKEAPELWDELERVRARAEG